MSEEEMDEEEMDEEEMNKKKNKTNGYDVRISYLH